MGQGQGQFKGFWWLFKYKWRNLSPKCWQQKISCKTASIVN